MTRQICCIALCVVLILLGQAGYALAQSHLAERIPLLQNLLACRAVAASADRLACFDRTSAALDDAERQGEVTVLDRAQVRDTRNRLFGLELTDLNIFGRSGPTEVIDSVETTLVSARQNQGGEWVFVLANGSTWRQIDTGRLTATPTPGSVVRVRQGAVGSYLISVNNSRSLRARRQR